MKSTYFDDLDIENYFEANNPTKIPTEAGLVQTKPQGINIRTSPRMNADGKLKDKLKKFAQSKKGKTIFKLTGLVGGVAVAIAFGPAIISALAPVLPAMKTFLAKKGISAKGPAQIVKKFHESQIGELPKDGNETDKAKKVVSGILEFFKKAKNRRNNGTQTALDDIILNKADETIQKISDGTLSVDAIVGDETPTKGSQTTTTTTEEKKTGIDMKMILIILVAVFVISKAS